MSPEGRLLMSPAGPPPPPRRAEPRAPSALRLGRSGGTQTPNWSAEVSGGHGERGEWCDRTQSGTHGDRMRHTRVVDRGGAAPSLVLWAGASGHDQPSTLKNPSRRRYVFEKTHALEIWRSRPQTHTAAGRCPIRSRDTWRDRWAIRGQDQPLRHGGGLLGPAWWRAISAHFKGLHSRAATLASAGSQ